MSRRATALAVPGEAEAELLDLARAIFPLPRSLTGDGVRRTLEAVSRWAPLELTEVPSGTRVFDWTVPPEWNVREAWVADETGRRLLDFADSPLHVVGYSEPVRARLSGAELDGHLHSIPSKPHAVPYRTSYYEQTWGFCVADATRRSLDPNGTYEAVIDATLDDAGSLSYGEVVIPGKRRHGEILVSTYVCHPSLANDNVSGIVVAAALARWLPPRTLERDVRILFAPSGVGTLCWLSRNESSLDRIEAGLVVACAGDAGPLTYKRSRRGTATIDRAAELTVRAREGAIRAFAPWGTDERQFCSPGFDLPVGVLNRTPNGLYDEYHTSDDDLSVLSPGSLLDTLDALAEIIETVDGNRFPVRADGRGEPHLSRHGIDGAMTGGLLVDADASRQALFWTLNLADGSHDLLEVAERAAVPFATVLETVRALEEAHLLLPAGDR